MKNTEVITAYIQSVCRRVSTVLLAAILGILLSACTSQQVLTEESALQTFPGLASLQQIIEQSDTTDIPLLAPESFGKATRQYAEALTLAQANDSKGEKVAAKGLNSYAKAEVNAKKAQDVFEEVLLARQRAVNEGAAQYSPKSFKAADKSLLQLTQDLETGEEKRAKAGRAAVTQLYADVELATLKGSAVDRAKDTITKAKRNDADDYAPKTLKLAEEEMDLATNVLDADRSRKEKAEKHAKLALYHARHAIEITEIAKNFEASDFEYEDIVLWHEEQLSQAVAPVKPEISFDKPSKLVIKDIASDLAKLSADYKAMSALTLEKQTVLSETKAETEKERQMNQAIADKFSKIQTLFSSSEADVYRQIDNVLIRAHGFQFASGKSEIDAENFSLMNKIIAAINEFPNSQIMVSGHTDSRGEDALNMTLSQDRADKVAKFLTEIGGVAGDNVMAIGFGEDKPVANNETAEGRAANRRVEILIDNSAGL